MSQEDVVSARLQWSLIGEKHFDELWPVRFGSLKPNFFPHASFSRCSKMAGDGGCIDVGLKVEKKG